jgi:Iron-containing redox enzyme
MSALNLICVLVDDAGNTSGMSVLEHDPATSAAAAMTPLADTLTSALEADDTLGLATLIDARPDNRRDRFATLLAIYDLHTAPLEVLGDSARHQHHPALAALKQRCEGDWLAELEQIPLPDRIDPSDAPAAMRALAARDRLPEVYKWVARTASWEEIVTFLSLEGGPDAGFDDLVAACQIGLTGPAKMELAVNYWDEMGNGDPDAVHTTVHDRLVASIEMPTLPLAGQPTSALARNAFGGLLATNRWLQPEMLGALGLIELQAGPRCRLVLQGFDRCGAPRGAYPFYEVHAEVDPRHGKDWLDNAITPTVAARPAWSPRIVRGAHWRSVVNAEFLADAELLVRGD